MGIEIVAGALVFAALAPLVWVLFGVLTPFGVLVLTGAAMLVMTPGLIRCAIVGRFP